MCAVTLNISLYPWKYAVVPICSRLANKYPVELYFGPEAVFFPLFFVFHFLFLCAWVIFNLLRDSVVQSVHIYYVSATFHTLFQALGKTEKQKFLPLCSNILVSCKALLQLPLRTIPFLLLLSRYVTNSDVFLQHGLWRW